jgi:hypothetical protein
MSRVEEVADQVAHHLDQIHRLFKNGVKSTLVLRTPGLPERDFMLGNDDIDEAIKALERAKARQPTTV